MQRSRTGRYTLLLAAVALAASTLPSHAQDARTGLALLGGGSFHTDLTPGFVEPTVFEPGWIAGVQAEAWLGGGRTGLRLNGLFTQRMLESAAGDYNVRAADLDLLVRILPVRPERLFAPYAVVGVGATRYAGLAGSPVLADGAYGGDPVIRGHVLAGLGADLLSGRRAGLRVEIADQVVLPSIGESPTATGLPTSHGLMVTAGIQLRMGRLGPDPVPAGRQYREPLAGASPEPAPAAKPEPAPAAKPEPALAGKPGSAAENPAERVAPPTLQRPLGQQVESAADREPVAPAERPPASEAESEALYTVQIGSLVEAATAKRWAERLGERGIPAWLLHSQVAGQPVSRVRVGALRSESEARGLAVALEREYGWDVRVDRVAAGELIPGDAVRRTTEFLGRQ
ncbi:MAG: SPOR domain-containing protein [Gemmatimonadota bacterium]